MLPLEEKHCCKLLRSALKAFGDRDVYRLHALIDFSLSPEIRTIKSGGYTGRYSLWCDNLHTYAQFMHSTCTFILLVDTEMGSTSK